MLSEKENPKIDDYTDNMSQIEESNYLTYFVNKKKRLEVAVPSANKTRHYTMVLTSKGWMHEPGDECEHIKYRGHQSKCRHQLICYRAMQEGTFINGSGQRINSKIAYSDLHESGVWGENCNEVLNIIIDNQDVTDKEIELIWNAKLTARGEFPKEVNSVTGRRNGLLKNGWIYESGKKINEFSGLPNNTYRAIFLEGGK